jgi:hypothetical protein
MDPELRREDLYQGILTYRELWQHFPQCVTQRAAQLLREKSDAEILDMLETGEVEPLDAWLNRENVSLHRGHDIEPPPPPDFEPDWPDEYFDDAISLSSEEEEEGGIPTH